MKLDVARVDVWAARVKDQSGGLNQQLEALAQAGANLEFVIARRTPENPGTGMVFVTPIKGAKQVKVAKQAGFKKTTTLHSIRIAAADRLGLGSMLTRQIAEAGINLRGFSAAAVGRKAVFHLAFDSPTDASKAMRRLKQMS